MALDGKLGMHRPKEVGVVEFCLLHRLGLFIFGGGAGRGARGAGGGLRILNFTIFGGFRGKGAIIGGWWGVVVVICRCVFYHFQNRLFLRLSKLRLFFLCV